MHFAKAITMHTIDEITELNEGVRPSEETLDDNTMFVYSNDPDVPNEILSRSDFKKRYFWLDPNSIDDNIVVKR